MVRRGCYFIFATGRAKPCGWNLNSFAPPVLIMHLHILARPAPLSGRAIGPRYSRVYGPATQ